MENEILAKELPFFSARILERKRMQRRSCRFYLFKKKKKFKEKEKSAGGVFDFHLTKPIFVGRDEGDVRHDV